NRQRDLCDEIRRATPRRHRHAGALLDAVPFRELRMQLRHGLWRHFDELGRSARLSARLVMSQHAACGQTNRKGLVGNLRRWLMLNRREPRPARGCRERIGKEPWTARVPFTRTGPEHAIFEIDSV